MNETSEGSLAGKRVWGKPIGNRRSVCGAARPGPRVALGLARLRGLEGVPLRNPLEINASDSKGRHYNYLAGVHGLERKSWVVVALATPV